jgi:hypothetical protein
MKYIKLFENFEESPLQGLIDKMYLRINDPEVTTKKLAEIIELAYEGREGLLESEGEAPENDWWAHKAIEDYTKIIVIANYKAQRKINPNIEIGDLDEQIEDALKEVKKRYKS